jgi:hypothetical protein
VLGQGTYGQVFKVRAKGYKEEKRDIEVKKTTTRAYKVNIKEERFLVIKELQTNLMPEKYAFKAMEEV